MLITPLKLFLPSKALNIARFGLLLLACAMLVACGGGNDADSTKARVDLIRVNAGPNLTLNETETADITGGSSGGSGAITYTWQADASIQITHASSASADASLVAPTLIQSAQYTVTLVATDATGSQQSDSFTLTVNPVNLPPVARISANQTEGYSVGQFPVTSIIQLDGSSSSDQDAPSNQASISDYNWQQIAGPSMLAGVNTRQATLQIIAPILDENASATIRLTVSDQELETATTEFTFTLLGQRETKVDVAVQQPRDVFSGEIVVLQGNASSLAPDASPFNAIWRTNSSAQISDASAFATHAISPLLTADATIAYEFEAQDSFRNTASVQTTSQVFAPTTRFINDTGVTMFATNNAVFSDYQQLFAGQDADYGADRQTASGQVIKVGDGDEGFDFTRLDNNGDIIDNPSFGFSCVRDNVTALIWQVKDNVNSDNINYVDQHFTWYREDDNGNVAGELNPNSTSCNVSNMQCNTQDYLDEINAQGLCGFFDWRLPEPNELQSIIHYGKTTPPLVDTIFMPFWGGTTSQPLWYWTMQSSADGVSDDNARAAWAFDMNSGNDAFLVKTTERRVVLVRAGR